MLEVFVGDWHPDNRGVEHADELRQLRAWKFRPESRDLASIARATRLEWLQLVQTSIESLYGVGQLEDLRYLEVAYAPKLTTLDALGAARSEVRELKLERANRIESYEPLSAVPFLRRVQLIGCAPMPDLQWTQGMDRLDFLSFVDTNVLSGDLTPLLDLPALRNVGTLDERHYSHKGAELNALLQERWAL